MYSNKKSVLQLVSLFKANGIRHIVISPGSRNAPIAQSFAVDKYFKCFSIVDERSAAYFAIGLIYKLQTPVALCCTSGSAILDYGPAISEAYYHELPLIIVSADRPQAWIGQMDGQTLPQPGIFSNIVKKSVNLPEVNDDESLWFCNRLINEAILSCRHHGDGPVHINVPISEPLFDFSVEELPESRVIKSLKSEELPEIDDFIDIWKKSRKRMIIAGQMGPGKEELNSILKSLAAKGKCIILNEYLSNIESDDFITNYDALISSIDRNESADFSPDLLITIGGHIVSNRIKKFIRKIQAVHHWHISQSGEVADTMQCLTCIIEASPDEFLKKIAMISSGEENSDFVLKWKSKSMKTSSPSLDIKFSDILATGLLMKYLPEKSVLFSANSSPVRNIQLFKLPSHVNVFCNRGVNGIEGILSTTCGYATLHEGLVFVITGDLSFFYDLNALWGIDIPENVRIFLINNGGGGIFHLLRGLDNAESLNGFISAQHGKKAENFVKASGIEYLSADSTETLRSSMKDFIKANGHPKLLEVYTDKDINKKVNEEYYRNLKIR